MINNTEKRCIYIPWSWWEKMEERSREEDGDVDANAMEGLDRKAQRLRDCVTERQEYEIWTFPSWRES